MTALEVCLIVIGIIAIVISYFISEKSAEERMKKAVDELVLSEETKRTLINQAKETVEETLNGMSEEISGKAEVQLEKLSNEKIMMVQEYSDTVLEEIGKNHHEVMFLYSMLDDKDKDVKKTVREAQKVEKTIREWNQVQSEKAEQENSLTERYLETEQRLEENQEQTFDSGLEEGQETKSRSERRSERTRERILRRKQERSQNGYQNGYQNEYKEDHFERDTDYEYRKRSRKRTDEKRTKTTELISNTGEYPTEIPNRGYPIQIEENREIYVKNEDKKRDVIIALCQQGLSNLEIARELGLAMGEVKLVIDLYYSSELGKGKRE